MLGGKGFMLARGQLKGRAWKRTGQPNAVRPRITDADSQRNALPPEVDFVAAYDDFSGGFGDANRDPSLPNRVHWSENMDLRFPRQAIHCQELRFPPAQSINHNVEGFLDVPLAIPVGTLPPAGTGTVLAYGVGFIGAYTPVPQGTFNFNTEHLDSAMYQGRAALFASYSYIGLIDPGGSGGFFQRNHDGTSFSQGPLPGLGFLVAGNRLWRHHGPPRRDFLLQSVDAGANVMATANWSATLTVGNGQMGIGDFIELSDQVFVGMQDGLYAGDVSGTFFNVLSELKGQVHVDNARDLTVWDGKIIVPHTAGLYAFQHGNTFEQATEVGPRGQSNRSPVRGRFRAVRGYGAWLVGGYWTGTVSYLLAGRKSQVNNEEVDWFVLNRLPNTAKVHRLHFDSITAPSGGAIEIPTRLWIATEASFGAAAGGTAPLYVYDIPTGFENPLSPHPTFIPRYVGSGRMDLGRDTRGAPETLKVLRRVEVNTDANTLLSGVAYGDVYYMLDGGSRTLLGRVQTSPKSMLYFPSGQGSFVTCYDFEMSLDSFSATSSMTPVYRSVVVHGAFLTDGTDEITAVVDVADSRADRNGTPMRPGSVQLAELRDFAGDVPQMLSDLTGAQSWVTVQRGITEEETYQEGSDEPEVIATIRMPVLAFSGG